MFRIIICLADSNRRSIVSSHVKACFSEKETQVSILLYSSSKQFIRQGINSLDSDIFIFDPLDENGQMLSVALSVKHVFPKVTTFVLGNTASISGKTLSKLQPVFSINLDDSKSFYTHLIDTYEQSWEDLKNFTYFNRPHFNTYPVDDILYFLSDKRRTHLISDNGPKKDISFYRKLDDVEYQLSHKKCNFVRIHQSYLVNVKFISSYNREFITLTNGDKLGISNYNYYKALRKII